MIDPNLIILGYLPNLALVMFWRLHAVFSVFRGILSKHVMNFIVLHLGILRLSKRTVKIGSGHSSIKDRLRSSVHF